MILETEIDGLLYALDTDEQEATVKESNYRWCQGEVTIPASFFHEGIVYRVTSIGDHAFSDCGSLSSITIAEGVVSIGERAFSSCHNLTSITVPKSVTSIGDNAFSDCSNLTAVHISSIKAWCKISFCNYTSNPLYYAHNLHLNGELIVELIIPEGVTNIGDYTFCGCSSLTSITLPKGVTSIGKGAFNGCSSLTSIILPKSVTSIGYAAFCRCGGLTVITIPENATSIGECTFSYCGSLTDIIVAEGNKMYDSREGCNAIIETKSGILIQGCSKTIIPESVTSIGRGAFHGCSSLTSITLPKGVTSIGEFAFYGCSSLASITFPKNVKSIKKFAFKKSGITYITILGTPTIGKSAFEECKKLTDIYCYSTEVPPAENAFIDIFDFFALTSITLYLGRITLHVPKGTIKQYKNTEPWKWFGTIVAIK